MELEPVVLAPATWPGPGEGWRTILPGMPPAAFALYASAACASGYTAPT